jgi:hypothetical protein
MTFHHTVLHWIDDRVYSAYARYMRRQSAYFDQPARDVDCWTDDDRGISYFVLSNAHGFLAAIEEGPTGRMRGLDFDNLPAPVQEGVREEMTVRD